jgi:hypothetical protein
MLAIQAESRGHPGARPTIFEGGIAMTPDTEDRPSVPCSCTRIHPQQCPHGPSNLPPGVHCAATEPHIEDYLGREQRIRKLIEAGLPPDWRVYRWTVTATGYGGHAAATGKNSIAASVGFEGTAQGALDTWIVLAAYDDNYDLVCVKTAKIGGPEGLKADTPYRLTSAGEFVEAA